ncbi:MAG: solute symporter family protein, partial [Corynebacterium variabile]
MNINFLAASDSDAGNPVLNIIIFVAFIVITMTIVTRVGKKTTQAGDFYTGGASFSGTQNGLAIAGDYLSAASFLGIVGSVALTGYDGFLYSIGFFVAWVVALLLVAEPLRNTGKFTMADVLSFRLKQRPVRLAASFATLGVTLFYLIAQMAGAGALVSTLLDIHEKGVQALIIAIVGAVM